MNENVYRQAGVDLAAAQNIKTHIAALAHQTHGPEVIGAVGGFGALYELSRYHNPILVSSTDGIGTKLRIAIMMDNYNGIGIDLVNACINDIIVCGADPLFFLDYLALESISTDIVTSIISGISTACKESGCALIGGETAQMPGIYTEGDFDMAGFVVGVVEKDNLITGSKIADGDMIIGLPSTGLHTNGYSLARHVLNVDNNPDILSTHHKDLGCTIGQALLIPHPSYYKTLQPILNLAKGLVHITGGGLYENIPRILPKGLLARIDSSTWKTPQIFSILQDTGNISDQEMYNVFNMGLGMIIFCNPQDSEEIVSTLPDALIVGEVIQTSESNQVSICRSR